MDAHLFYRQKRQSLGISLEEAAQRTKIRSAYLKAIENGDFAQLPDAFFAKSYIRDYALFLTISPDPLILEYDRYLSQLNRNATNDLAELTMPEKPSDAEIAELIAYETNFPKKKFIKISFILGICILLSLTVVLILRYYPLLFDTDKTSVDKTPHVNLNVSQQTQVPNDNQKQLTATVNVDMATLRIDPHLDAQPLTWAARGVSFIVKDIYTEEDTGKKWYKVTTSNGKDCWIADKVVAITTTGKNFNE